MASLKLCREKIQITHPATLGIHSNKAGDENEYTSGHAWVSVHTPTRDIYLGLWPDGHPRVIEKSPHCTDVRVGMELGARPLASRYYKLTPPQIQKLNAFLNKPDVWKYTNNCATWATRLVREVIGANISAIDYALFSTPRELGKEILLLEKVNPTSKMYPRTGAADFGKGVLNK